MNARKILAILLVFAMVFSIPLAASATEEEEWVLDCSGWWTAHSEGVLITEELQSWSFTSKTYTDATDNWHTPVAVIFHSADGIVNGEGYVEKLVARSDNYAWTPEANPYASFETIFAEGHDWAAWLEANKAGVECTVTAQIVNGNVVFGISNSGVTSVYVVPLNGVETPVYLSMTGEKCTLTGWQATDSHIDISRAAASVAATEPDPSEEPAPSEEPTEAPTEEPANNWVVDCPIWWGGHSTPVKLTEYMQSWTFVCTTYPEATDNWDTATVVVWRSSDGTMGGDGYLEELLVRSDSYAVSEEYWWGTDGQASFGDKNYPADWGEWLAANKAGAVCTVTAQIVNGNVVVGFSNNGVTNVYVVPLNQDLDSPVYLSLTGEQCTLTNWKTTKNHIDIDPACRSVGGEAIPKTGDSTNLVVIFSALLLSAAGIIAVVSVNKKRFF